MLKRNLAYLFALVAALGLAACSSNPAGDDDSAQPDGGSTGSGDGGTTDDGAVTLTMTSFLVPKHSEVYKCQNFANPFGGEDVEIHAFESHMTPGSHHLLLFYMQDASDDSIEDCSGLEFHATPYGSQTPDDMVAYPDGIAALVKSNQGFRVQAHYLNTTDEDINAVVTVTLHPAEPGTVTAHAGVVFMNNSFFSVPASGSPETVSKTCALPRDIHLLYANSHMHKHGIDFVATSNGSELYHTQSWDDPEPAVLTPPLEMTSGQEITFSCTYINDTGSPLTFGESADTDEMCIFTGQYYPAPDTDNPMITCF